MAFSIDNYYELMALHRVIMEAKFSIDPNDLEIQRSPMVANIANQVVEALIDMEVSKEGESSRSKWQEWRKFSPDRREYKIVQAKIKSEALWKTWSFDEQKTYIKDLVSPLQISDELVSQLISSAT
jgi:hypothetical protein